MNAEEMFEALGYKSHSCAEAYICYEKENCFNEHVCIEFYIMRREFYAQCNRYAHDINMNEFKAIQQQLKELGWI